MIILTIRTDKPEAEIGLYEDSHRLDYVAWQAHRELAETIHAKIAQLLKGQNKSWQDVEGIVCFKGPGSFTGLRIGAALASALKMANDIALVGSDGEDWIASGLKALENGCNESAIPFYGSEAHITLPKK